GHMSLIEHAIAENDIVVVSIFVNPLQFGPAEDFQKYPRSWDEDYRLCEQLGVDILFTPTLEEMSLSQGQDAPPATTTVVPSTAMMSVLCGPFRPGHFTGVATIVTKLLNIVQPTTAYFGEKDAQQLTIIRALVKDLDLPVEIRGCPIVRELSGLAYSSRNQYLTEPEKEQALALSRGLQQAQNAFRTGERSTLQLVEIVKQELALIPQIKIQYVELVEPQTLIPLEKIETAGLLAIACYIGSTRLIDNVILRQRQPIIAIDGPAGAGKSTVTRQVAQRLGFMYLDTGAMYRAVTWLVMQSGIGRDDESAIAELVSGVTIELIPANSPDVLTQVRIDGKDVTDAIRTPEVTANVSAISAQVAVRRALVQQQQRYGERGGIVAEGRDIGTQVFPDAELKIFLTASAQERARRRLQELKDRGEEEINLEQLERDIQKRDYLDSSRPISPLQRAADAIEINTDGLSIEAVTEQIISLF
ncbi:MAG: bifunctional pantoate--beta-alanine ligase/(d)CMP kinase, partial [Microcystaceae cyanobacterium]